MEIILWSYKPTQRCHFINILISRNWYNHHFGLWNNVMHMTTNFVGLISILGLLAIWVLPFLLLSVASVCLFMVGNIRSKHWREPADHLYSPDWNGWLFYSTYKSDYQSHQVRVLFSPTIFWITDNTGLILYSCQKKKTLMKKKKKT